MFKSIKLTTVLALLVAVTMTMLLAGCEGDSSKSSSTTEQPLNTATGPVGNVKGVVLSNQGMPIAGATVTLGDLQTTTNSGGQYIIRNVEVTRAIGADQMNGKVWNQLTITVQANGYFGAITTVDPVAQFDGSNDYTGASPDLGVSPIVEAEGNNKTVTLVDGFTVEAGPVLLPPTNVTISACVRNCNTGEPLPSQVVRAVFDELDQKPVEEFDSIGNGGWDDDAAVVSEFYISDPTVSAMTGADGCFTLSNSPAFAELELYIDGAWTFKGYSNSFGEHAWIGGEKFETGPFGSSNFIGDFEACPIVSGDNIKPNVSKAAPVAFTATCLECNSETPSSSDYRAILDEGFDGVLTITFTEVMDSAKLDSDSIIIRNLTQNVYVTDFTASLAGKTLTITFGATVEFEAGDQFDVILDKNDFTDLSGNVLWANSNLGYDYWALYGHSGNCADNDCYPYIKLCLAIYQAPNTTTGEITGEQFCDTGIYTDSADMAALHAYAPSVFVDCCNSISGFQQLNGKGTDQDYVEAVLDLMGKQLTKGAPAFYADINVDTDYAAIHFTPDAENDVDTYLISPGSGNTLETNCESSDNLCGYDGNTVYVADTSKTAKFAVVGADIGDKVTITPVDDFGFQGTPFTITLHDCAEPTIAPQTAYGVCNTEGGVAALFAYGRGAELSDEGVAGEEATLVYPVTPRMLGRQLSTPYNGSDVLVPALPLPAPYLAEAIVLWDLYELNTQFRELDEVALTDPLYQIQDEFLSYDVYDATAFAAYAPSRRVGLAVTEDLSSFDSTQFTYDGTAALSNWGQLNNVDPQDNAAGLDSGGENTYPNGPMGEGYNADFPGFEVPADILLFDVDQIIDWANNDHGAILDVTGGITDMDNLVASEDAHAYIAIYDRMPPFVTLAYFGDPDNSGDNELTIVFDTPVTFDATVDTVSLVQPGNPLVVCTTVLTAGMLSVDQMTITIDQDDLCGGGFNAGVYFPTADTPVDAIYDEDAYDFIAGEGTDLPHGILEFDQVQDALGNSWENWNGSDASTNCVVPNGQVDTPRFAAVNAAVVHNLEIGVRATVIDGVAGQQTSIPAGTCAATLRWTATVDIDWATMFGANGYTNDIGDDYNGLGVAISNAADYFAYGPITTGNLVLDIGALTTVNAVPVNGRVLDVSLVWDPTVECATAGTAVGALYNGVDDNFGTPNIVTNAEDGTWYDDDGIGYWFTVETSYAVPPASPVLLNDLDAVREQVPSIIVQ